MARSRRGETYAEKIRRATVHRDEDARAIELPGGTIYSVDESRFVEMVVEAIRMQNGPLSEPQAARLERRILIYRRLCRPGEWEEAEAIVAMVDSQSPDDA